MVELDWISSSLVKKQDRKPRHHHRRQYSLIDHAKDHLGPLWCRDWGGNEAFRWLFSFFSVSNEGHIFEFAIRHHFLEFQFSCRVLFEIEEVIDLKLLVFSAITAWCFAMIRVNSSKKVHLPPFDCWSPTFRLHKCCKIPSVLFIASHLWDVVFHSFR
jgi:hypothetical protein